MSKVCRGCGVTKPHTHFTREKRARDGLRARCRECTRQQSAEWRAANPERRKTYDRQAAQARKEYQREWRAANPERVRAYRQTYESKADARDYLTQWRKAHG